MFRTLMIGAASALTLSAAALAQRRFGLIIAGAVLASIFAGLSISTVEAQSGVVGHGQKAGKRFPFKAQQEPPQLTPAQKRRHEESLRRHDRHQDPPLPEAQAPAAAPQAPPTASPTEVLGIGTSTFTKFLQTPITVPGTTLSGTREPQAATNGPIVFYTGNWFAAFSTDGGMTFTFVDPFTQFGPFDDGFCCDTSTQRRPEKLC